VEEGSLASWLAGVSLIGGPLSVSIYVAAALSIGALLIPWLRRRRKPMSAIAALGLGFGGGLLLCWIVGDVLNTFGVSFTPVTRLWVAASCAGIGLAVASIPRSSARGVVGAISAMLVLVLLGATGVNADFGQYQTVGQALGLPNFPQMSRSVIQHQKDAASPGGSPLWRTWKAPVDLPARGMVGLVHIPGTVSTFPARTAVIYLPPAALVAAPPTLPVMIMLSGQPGNPEDVFLAGRVQTVMDDAAAAHGGLAPIVVVPDQLSAPSINPLCVDSALGNSATYLTVDVPAWIRSHLAVDADPASWGIGGWSQGGTCAIQLGAGYPALFGSILDMSGEVKPTLGTDALTVLKGFGGDAVAYEAAQPLSLLEKNAPFVDSVAIFAAGSLDSTFSPGIAELAAAARVAGMQTDVFTSPGTGHDWYTVRYALTNGLPIIYRHMGLAGPYS